MPDDEEKAPVVKAATNDNKDKVEEAGKKEEQEKDSWFVRLIKNIIEWGLEIWAGIVERKGWNNQGPDVSNTRPEENNRKSEENNKDVRDNPRDQAIMVLLVFAIIFESARKDNAIEGAVNVPNPFLECMFNSPELMSELCNVITNYYSTDVGRAGVRSTVDETQPNLKKGLREGVEAIVKEGAGVIPEPTGGANVVKTAVNAIKNM